MGGKSSYQKDLEKQQADTNQQFLNIAKTQTEQGNQELAQRKQLRQPFIDQQTAFASGDRKAIINAASPAFSQINAASQQNRSNIQNNVTGAERDFLLNENDRDKTNSTYSYIAQLFGGAPQNLAALGSENAQVGLAQGNAGMSAFGQSANLGNNLIQQENQRRQATLGFVGNLFGVAGSLAGGGLFGKKGG